MPKYSCEKLLKMRPKYGLAIFLEVFEPKFQENKFFCATYFNFFAIFACIYAILCLNYLYIGSNSIILNKNRISDLKKAIKQLFPAINYYDACEILDLCLHVKYQRMPATICVWLSSIAYIRHNYTDYDTLLAQGYPIEAARIFTIEAINYHLQEWQSVKLLNLNESEDNLSG